MFGLFSGLQSLRQKIPQSGKDATKKKKRIDKHEQKWLYQWQVNNVSEILLTQSKQLHKLARGVFLGRCWLANAIVDAKKTKWGQCSVTESNDLTLSMQEGGGTLELNYIHEKEQEHSEGKKTVALVSQDNKDKEATDLVTDLVRMGYFFRRRRYCCNSRIWMAASRIGRLSTGIVRRVTVPHTAATELTGTKFGTRCGDIFLSTSLRDC